MSSKVDCPHCKMRLNIAPEMFGHPLKCPGCQIVFTPEPKENHPASIPQAAPSEPQQPSYPPPPTPSGSQPPMNLGPQPPDSNPLPLVLGCLGGGCLLIVVIAVLVFFLTKQF